MNHRSGKTKGEECEGIMKRECANSKSQEKKFGPSLNLSS